MAYLFTSESVSEGHPDKVSDQISDALLDQFLAYDDKARCAIETFVTTGQVVIMGEVHSDAYIDLQTIARKTIKKIGYTKSEYQFDGESCGILTSIHEQGSKLFSTIAACNIRITQIFTDKVCNALQDKVSAFMTIGIIKLFKEVYIKHNYGNILFIKESRIYCFCKYIEEIIL